jgi:hypothetical protein
MYNRDGHNINKWLSQPKMTNRSKEGLSMTNLIKITIAQLGEYNEIKEKTIYLNASEISEISEPLSKPGNLDNCYGGCYEKYQSIVVMTNGRAFRAIQSMDEIISQLEYEN